MIFNKSNNEIKVQYTKIYNWRLDIYLDYYTLINKKQLNNVIKSFAK